MVRLRICHLAKRNTSVSRVMAADVLVDTGFLVALLAGRDAHHQWAVAQASELPPPWFTCEAVLSETFHLLEEYATPTSLGALLRRRALRVVFSAVENMEPLIKLIERYSNVPMSFADACLVRMTELHSNPIVLTTDRDFRIYRRHSRHVVPVVMPD